LKSEGGFDFGTTIIKNARKFSNEKYYIDFKNENILVRDSSKKVLIGVKPQVLRNVNYI